jgi:hypothetical protein
MGSPVLFKQPRPGIIKNGKETMFDMYKFRSMTDKRDENGNLLPDADRLPAFGRLLRSTSLEGHDIIRQTTGTVENKGFCEVSPIHFFTGRDLILRNIDYLNIDGGVKLLAENQGQERLCAA